MEPRRLLAAATYTSVAISTSAIYDRVLPADWDGDGDVDILTCNRQNGSLALLLQQTDHTFVTKSVTAIANSPDAFPQVAADLNGDGLIDWVGSPSGNTGSLTWALNTGNGTFGPSHALPLRGASGAPVSVVDLDRDGDLDVVVPEITIHGVEAFFNNGSGAFSPAVVVSGYGNDTGSSGAAADIDGDDDIDLLIPSHGTSPSGLHVLLNDGHGAFSDGQFIPFPSGWAIDVAAADFDNDGDVDLVTGDFGTTSPFQTFYNDGSGQFGSPTVVKQFRVVQSIAAADLNGDSAADVYGGNPSLIAWNNGKGTLTGNNSAYTENLSAAPAIDVNGDGRLDLVRAGFIDYGGGYTDTLAPVASRGKFIVSPQAGPPALRIDFSEPVHSVAHANPLITLQNLTTGATIDTSKFATISDAGDIISWLLPKNLPDGNYRATLAAATTLDVAGNHLASDFIYTFQVLAGDTNRDGKVDVVDLGTLSTNWQKDKSTFAQGDVNYDGKVDVVDLGIVSTNWQKSLPAPPAATPLRPIVVVAPKKTIAVLQPPAKTAADATFGLQSIPPIYTAIALS